MTILNIHGYHSNPKNSAYTALHEIGCKNIISPSIDYDNEEPGNIMHTAAHGIFLRNDAVSSIPSDIFYE